MRFRSDAIERLVRSVVHDRVQHGVDIIAAAVGVEPERESGGRHDAFTHAYVSARLAIRLGRRVAALMGDLNEKLGSEAAGKYLEAAMDRHNNAAGREIGVSQRGEGAVSKRETAERVKQLLDNGGLRVIATASSIEPKLVPS